MHIFLFYFLFNRLIMYLIYLFYLFVARARLAVFPTVRRRHFPTGNCRVYIVCRSPTACERLQTRAQVVPDCATFFPLAGKTRERGGGGGGLARADELVTTLMRFTLINRVRAHGDARNAGRHTGAVLQTFAMGNSKWQPAFSSAIVFGFHRFEEKRTASGLRTAIVYVCNNGRKKIATKNHGNHDGTYIEMEKSNNSGETSMGS